MATEHTTDRRGRARTPLLTLVAVAAIAAGLAMGLQALDSPANAGAVAAAPAAVPAINAADPTSSDGGGGTTSNGGNIVSHPRPTPVVAAQACQAMDAAAQRIYCGSPRGARVVVPRVTWQACAAMDVAGHRLYCLPGDGGRWIEAPGGDRE